VKNFWTKTKLNSLNRFALCLADEYGLSVGITLFRQIRRIWSISGYLCVLKPVHTQLWDFLIATVRNFAISQSEINLDPHLKMIASFALSKREVLCLIISSWHKSREVCCNQHITVSRAVWEFSANPKGRFGISLSTMVRIYRGCLAVIFASIVRFEFCGCFKTCNPSWFQEGIWSCTTRWMVFIENFESKKWC
jgi:hypothetical protein